MIFGIQGHYLENDAHYKKVNSLISPESYYGKNLL